MLFLQVHHLNSNCRKTVSQIHSSCTSMSLWLQNNPSLWLLWTVSIPKWVSILWHGASAPSDAKLLEGGVSLVLVLADERTAAHDDVIKWKHSPRYWPFVHRIHRSPVNSPRKGQWRGALMFSLICAWLNAWVNISWGWWFKMPSPQLWRHCNVYLQKVWHESHVC